MQKLSYDELIFKVVRIDIRNSVAWRVEFRFESCPNRPANLYCIFMILRLLYLLYSSISLFSTYFNISDWVNITEDAVKADIPKLNNYCRL